MTEMAKHYKVSRTIKMNIVQQDLKMKAYKHQEKRASLRTREGKRASRARELLAWYARNPYVVVIFSDEKLFVTTKKF
jgi:hypothetical protein